MLSNGRRGPRFESDADDNIQPRGRTMEPYAPPSAAKPSALAMLSLIISMLALGLAVWALAVPPDPLITPPPTPGQAVGQAGGDRVARLENDMQRALLHLVTMEERLKKLQARLTAIAPDQAAAEPAIDPLEPIATALAPLSAAEPQPEAQAAPAAEPVAPAPTPPPAVAEKPTPAPTPKPAPTAQPTPKPTARPSVPASFTAKHIYKVKPGDNLYSVARAFGVKKEDLCAWNGLDKDTLIKVDQSLVIYK